MNQVLEHKSMHETASISERQQCIWGPYFIKIFLLAWGQHVPVSSPVAHTELYHISVDSVIEVIAENPR